MCVCVSIYLGHSHFSLPTALVGFAVVFGPKMCSKKNGMCLAYVGVGGACAVLGGPCGIS